MQLLYVLGEAGLGKSRLLAELLRNLGVAGAGPRLMLAQGCEQRQRQPYGLLRALLSQGQAGQALDEARAAQVLLQASGAFDAMQMPHLALEALGGLAELALQQGRPDEALGLLEAILARQADGISLDGADEPMRVRLTCCLVLAACADRRAGTLLQASLQLLPERAGRIASAGQREACLRQVPHHRGLLDPQAMSTSCRSIRPKSPIWWSRSALPLSSNPHTSKLTWPWRVDSWSSPRTVKLALLPPGLPTFIQRWVVGPPVEVVC